MTASTKSTLLWNDQLRLMLSDVDETIADLYRPAERRMLTALSSLLEQGTVLVLITGQSIDNVEERVVLGLSAPLRRRIAVGACSGAELWGYTPAGNRREHPYYTAEGILTDEQKKAWRAVVQQLIKEFHLSPSKSVPICDFKQNFGDEPLCVMLDDRGPQITFEFPNACRLSTASRESVYRELGIQLEGDDALRSLILARAQQLLEELAVPVTARLAGMFALDLAIAGIDKARVVEQVFSPAVLDDLGLADKFPTPNEIEIWGDRFSRDVGTDWLMCKSVNSSVRAISFRSEDPKGFPEGYNIRLWDGMRRLHGGLLEFLEGHL